MPGSDVLAPAAAAETGSDMVGDTITPTRLVHELCHDLIEPAASITLLSRALCVSAGTNPAVQQQLQLIANQASRIADICGQVLDRPTRPDPVFLDELAAETAATARLRHGSAVEVIASPVVVDVHPAVAVRILNNLVTNACEAVGPRGTVRLVVAAENGLARLEVADSGRGFRLAEMGRTSFGLEIIWRLVLGCGGTVQMGVSDLGGLCVTVLLPCRNPGENEVTEK